MYIRYLWFNSNGLWSITLYLSQANDEPYDFFTKFICDTIMGPTVFKTAKMRREELGGGMMLTEVRPLMS
jgi:hypothetical protein